MASLGQMKVKTCFATSAIAALIGAIMVWSSFESAGDILHKPMFVALRLLDSYEQARSIDLFNIKLQRD